MKLFKSKISYVNHGRPLGWGSGADADWRVLFSLFLLAVVGIVVYSTLLFLKAKNDDLMPTGADAQINVSKNSIKSTADFYMKRAKDFEAIKSSPETLTDPSL